MGSLGEIYVRNSKSVVELWHNFDTYGDYIMRFFKLFAKYAAWAVGEQQHWLTYPENVAAMLVAFDYEVHLASGLVPHVFEACPDLRPRGGISNFEKVWILDIPEFNWTEDITWRVREFDRKYGANPEEIRENIRRMKDTALKYYLKKTCDFVVKPENDKGGCEMCGYPGPLLLIEDPPLCIYCFAKRVKSNDFVRGQVEQILKIEPLVS